LRTHVVHRMEAIEMIEATKDIPKEFWEDREWAWEHYEELMRQYPNRWVAIVDKRVVAVSDGPTDYIEEARRKTGRKHIPVVFIEDGYGVY
jgi:hypothetical protein